MELGANDLRVFRSSSSHPTATCITISLQQNPEWFVILLTEVVLELWPLNEWWRIVVVLVDIWQTGKCSKVLHCSFKMASSPPELIE